MRARGRMLLAAATLSCVFATTPLAAASPTTSDDASALVVRGVEHFKHQEYERAREAFSSAFERSPETPILFNLALAELQSGHAAEAVKHLRQYVAAPDAAPDKANAIRSKWLPRAESEAGLLRVEAPARTEILVDGASVGSTPLAATVPVSPGEHRVEGRLEASTGEAKVDARAGVITPVSLVLRAEPPATSPAPTPTQSPAKTPPEPDDFNARAKLFTVLLFGIAAVASGAITIVSVQTSSRNAATARSLRAELASPSACTSEPPSGICMALRNAVDDKYSYRNFAVGFGIAGASLAVADVALLLLWPTRSSSVVASPIGRDGAMLGWRGSF